MSDPDPICMCEHPRSAHTELLFECEAITCKCPAFVDDSGETDIDKENDGGVIDEDEDVDEPVEAYEQDPDWWKT